MILVEVARWNCARERTCACDKDGDRWSATNFGYALLIPYQGHITRVSGTKYISIFVAHAGFPAVPPPPVSCVPLNSAEFLFLFEREFSRVDVPITDHWAQ